jgi:3-oxoacyl-[acyl-carrier-protein] synthase III
MPSDSPDIGDVITGRYKATHVLFGDGSIATVLRATFYMRLRSIQFTDQMTAHSKCAFFDALRLKII